MTTVWVLYEETGEYSDYSMGIKGVFSSVQAAIKEHDMYCALMAAVVAVWDKDDYEQAKYRDRQDWKEHDGSWHCAEGGKSHYDRLEWTIAPYILDAPYNAQAEEDWEDEHGPRRNRY